MIACDIRCSGNAATENAKIQAAKSKSIVDQAY